MTEPKQVKPLFVYEAEAEAFKAKALLHKTQAKREQLAVDASKIELDKKKEIRTAELAENKYHHVLHFNSSVNEQSAKAAIDTLARWMRTEPGCDIEIIFSSPGGSVVDGMALYDYIQYVRTAGHKVTTACLGMAASMAGILLQAGDTRVMFKESWLMIHEASFGASGKTGEVEDRLEWVKKVQNRILDIFAERAKISRATIKRNWSRKDWWISSDEALKAGLVDEVR